MGEDGEVKSRLSMVRIIEKPVTSQGSTLPKQSREGNSELAGQSGELHIQQ